MIRHGWKLKKLGSAKGSGPKNKPKIPRTHESIEITIRGHDRRILFRWDPATGNLKQGLYECLDFTQRGLGISLDDVLEPPKEQGPKEKTIELGPQVKVVPNKSVNASKS